MNAGRKLKKEKATSKKKRTIEIPLADPRVDFDHRTARIHPLLSAWVPLVARQLRDNFSDYRISNADVIRSAVSELASRGLIELVEAKDAKPERRGRNSKLPPKGRPMWMLTPEFRKYDLFSLMYAPTIVRSQLVWKNWPKKKGAGHEF